MLLFLVQDARTGSLPASTLPFVWLTKGRLTRELKCTSGGASGYDRPQVILRL